MLGQGAYRMVGRGVVGRGFGWGRGARCLGRKTLRSAGWGVESAVRWLVGGMLVGWVLRGWRMGERGLAGMVHLVLRFVLVVQMVQEYHF